MDENINIRVILLNREELDGKIKYILITTKKEMDISKVVITGKILKKDMTLI